LRGGAHFQNQNAGFHFAGFDGSAGGSGDFVAGRNFDFELRGFSLHYGNVGERGDSALLSRGELRGVPTDLFAPGNEVGESLRRWSFYSLLHRPAV
jgi:hypothetical protein